MERFAGLDHLAYYGKEDSYVERNSQYYQGLR